MGRVERFKMFEENIRKVNKIIAVSLAVSSLVLLALLASDWLGIFHFTIQLKITIVVAGVFTTVLPVVLYNLKVPANFLKYYMLISMSVIIGVLGINNGIGIYLTYILVPVASCLYFDKLFTLKIGGISYLIMAISVYFNSFGKMEVTYKNWSQITTFRNYMIGFTLEYIVCMVFVYQIVKRTGDFLKLQQDTMKILEEENKRQQEVSQIYKGSLSDQKRTAFEMVSKEAGNFSSEDYTRIATGHSFNGKLQNLLTYADDFERAMRKGLKSIGEYYDLDRIFYVTLNNGDNTISFTYQWNRFDDDSIDDKNITISEVEVESIAKRYDEIGYMMLVKDKIGTKEQKLAEGDFTHFIETIILGRQLWLPTLNSGQYSGAICFDKHDTEDYSTVDKFLLTDVVSILGAQIARSFSDQANKAKSAFLSSMSHEIRTPMNAIIGMTNVSLREEMDDNLRKNFNVIKSSAEGLLGIINDILDFSKIESGRIDIISEDYRVLSLMNDICTMAEARNEEKKLTLIYNIPEDLPSVLNGDMVRVKQIMVNLITNAIKYTDEGSVEISISCPKLDDTTSMLKFSVKDTGQGIREEDMDKLFNSFSQVNTDQNHHKEGTGLGLAIAKQLVELMGGSIGVESTFGEGSHFYFQVPQGIVDGTPAGTLSKFSYDVQTGDDYLNFTAPEANILIVDDNEVNLMVAEALFEPFEMNITLASGGHEALGYINKNEYDIIFMDHFMPEMSGDEVTKIIRALEKNPNRNKPIVALTADAVAGVKEEMFAAGMNEFLSKPIDMKAASKILRKYLGSKCISN